MNSFTKKILVVAGPTASGKSDLALKIAQQVLNNKAVIINADSLQIYKNLPLLTAQPSQTDFNSVPHKLFAYLEPYENCTAGIWAEQAKEQIEKAFDHGITPILVGGTGLYIHSLLFGLAHIPDIPDEIRSEAVDMQTSFGQEKFYQQLCKLDPNVEENIKPNDKQRSLRAWEVFQHTKKSIYDWHLEQTDEQSYDISAIFLFPDREQAYQKANSRFEKMIDMGVLEEVRAFKDKYSEHQFTSPALGYEELSDALDEKISLEEAIEISQRITRNYIKRQMTWFRNQTVPKIKNHLVIEDFGQNFELYQDEIRQTLSSFCKDSE